VVGLSWESVTRARTAGSDAGAREVIRAGYERTRLVFELGEQIRTTRERRGMTQDDLAKRAGTSQPAIARMEAGGVEPRIDTMERIGRALGIDRIVRFEEPAGHGR
jgi:HTH-type transcriptional regulator/antitoxin HipB